jgi:hypothetical protein
MHDFEVQLVESPTPWLLIGVAAVTWGVLAGGVVLWLFRRPK